MRTRSTYEPLILTTASSSQWTNSITGVVTNRASPKVVESVCEPTRSHFEAASDLNPTKHTYNKWNRFEHYSARAYRLQSGVDVQSYKFLASSSYFDRFYVAHPLWMWNDNAFGTPDSPTMGLPALYSPTSDEKHFVLPSVDVSEINAKALQAMLPHIRPSMSLVNSIYELKDFKRFPDTLRKLNTVRKHIIGVARAAKKRWFGKPDEWVYVHWLGRRTLRKALNSTADGFLQEEFAIAPLIRDCLSLWGALGDTAKELKKLQDAARRINTHHYNCELNRTAAGLVDKDEWSANFTDASPGVSRSRFREPGTSTWTKPYLCAGVKTRRLTTYPIYKFHAEIQFFCWYSRFQREYCKLLTLLDVLGVNVNPAIIWNGLPWSFVVDWVFGIGQWLDQFKDQNMTPVTLIHRYLWSMAVTREVTIVQQYNNNSANYRPFQRHVLRFVEKGYRREIDMPSLQTALSTSGISLKEIMLSSAIALGKLR